MLSPTRLTLFFSSPTACLPLSRFLISGLLIWAPDLFAQLSLNVRLSFLPLAGHTSSAPSDPSTCPQERRGQQIQ